MAYIDWTECLKVGHRFMDQDHERMVACLNQLVEALVGDIDELAGVSRHHAIEGAFASLRAVTEAHFRHEEAAMAVQQYPELAIHKAQHDALLAQLRTASDPLHSPAAGASIQFAIRFWREWFEYHVENYDVALADWLLASTRTE